MKMLPVRHEEKAATQCSSQTQAKRTARWWQPLGMTLDQPSRQFFRVDVCSGPKAEATQARRADPPIGASYSLHNVALLIAAPGCDHLGDAVPCCSSDTVQSISVPLQPLRQRIGVVAAVGSPTLLKMLSCGCLRFRHSQFVYPPMLLAVIERSPSTARKQFIMLLLGGACAR